VLDENAAVDQPPRVRDGDEEVTAGKLQFGMHAYSPTTSTYR
jgi:hypothetical protein